MMQGRDMPTAVFACELTAIIPIWACVCVQLLHGSMTYFMVLEWLLPPWLAGSQVA